jgi:hypothetical protein
VEHLMRPDLTKPPKERNAPEYEHLCNGFVNMGVLPTRSNEFQGTVFPNIKTRTVEYTFPRLYPPFMPSRMIQIRNTPSSETW